MRTLWHAARIQTGQAVALVRRGACLLERHAATQCEPARPQRLLRAVIMLHRAPPLPWLSTRRERRIDQPRSSLWLTSARGSGGGAGSGGAGGGGGGETHCNGAWVGRQAMRAVTARTFDPRHFDDERGGVGGRVRGGAVPMATAAPTLTVVAVAAARAQPTASPIARRAFHRPRLRAARSQAITIRAERTAPDCTPPLVCPGHLRPPPARSSSRVRLAQHFEPEVVIKAL